MKTCSPLHKLRVTVPNTGTGSVCFASIKLYKMKYLMTGDNVVSQFVSNRRSPQISITVSCDEGDTFILKSDLSNNMYLWSS
jgi:hypothetical protein